MKVGRLRIEWEKKSAKQELHEQLKEGLVMTVKLLMYPAVMEGFREAGYTVNWEGLTQNMKLMSGWKSEDDVLQKISN